MRAVRRSSPHGYHLPLNNVRAIRVLHGSKSHPDSQRQPAGLILTPTGTPIFFFAVFFLIIKPDLQLSRFSFSSMSSNSFGHKSAPGIIYEFSLEDARITVHGAALRPRWTRSGKLICAPPRFRRADQVQTCSVGGGLQRVRLQKAPLFKSLTQKKSLIL